MTAPGGLNLKGFIGGSERRWFGLKHPRKDLVALALIGLAVGLFILAGFIGGGGIIAIPIVFGILAALVGAGILVHEAGVNIKHLNDTEVEREVTKSKYKGGIRTLSGPANRYHEGVWWPLERLKTGGIAGLPAGTHVDYLQPSARRYEYNPDEKQWYQFDPTAVQVATRTINGQQRTFLKSSDPAVNYGVDDPLFDENQSGKLIGWDAHNHRYDYISALDNAGNAVFENGQHANVDVGVLPQLYRTVEDEKTAINLFSVSTVVPQDFDTNHVPRVSLQHQYKFKNHHNVAKNAHEEGLRPVQEDELGKQSLVERFTPGKPYRGISRGIR